MAHSQCSYRPIRWPIGVMFAAHRTISPLHNLVASQTCHFTNLHATSQTGHFTNLPLHKPFTSQIGHFTNLPLHKPTAIHYRLSLRSRAGLVAACYNMIVYMHGARTYTGQVTRLCTGIVLHERSRKMSSSAERGGEEGGILS